MNVQRILTGEIEENCYLLTSGKELLVIDPGADGDVLAKHIAASGLKPRAILLTHTHYDHIGASDLLRDKYHIPLYVHPAENDWLGDPIKNLSGLWRHNDIADVIIRPADELLKAAPYSIGDFRFEVRETPGHSMGSVSFVFPEDQVVFTGDALFSGSIGRTDLFSGSMEQLKESITSELFTLPDDYLALPGHGPQTSIGHEKQTNPFFQ